MHLFYLSVRKEGITMKSRKILKKTLSAVLCAAMLVNPVIAANASALPYGVPRSPEITEDYMEGKIPATFYLWDVYKSKDTDGSDFIGRSPAYLLKANISVLVSTVDGKEVETFDLGEFFSGTETSIIAGLPADIRDKYGDRSKYKVTIIVTPDTIDKDKTLVDINTMKTIDNFRFEYKNENEFKADIDIEYADKKYHTQNGVIHLKAPTKTAYQLGEEFDVSGGFINGFGDIRENGNLLDEWCVPNMKLTLDDLDISEFDNTKPGEYLIKLKPINKDIHEYTTLTDNTVYDSFYVTVADENGNVPKTETTKPAPEDEDAKVKEFRLRFNKYISSDYDNEQKMDVVKSEKLNGMKFSLCCDVYDCIYEEPKEIASYYLGDFDMGDTSEITIDVPYEVLKKYNEPERFSCDYTVKALDLPDDKVICDAGSFKSGGSNTYSFSLADGENIFDIFLRDKIVCKMTGGTRLTPPDKTVYKIGEKLDLTGSTIAGSGGGEIDGRLVLNWDIFSHDTKLNDLDISEFNNMRPGEYTIRAKHIGCSMTCDEIVEEIHYDSFKVTVVGDDLVMTDDVETLSEMRGDSNLDGDISLADAICIMQFVANPDKHGMCEQAMKNSDVTGDNDGVTTKDALVIQKYKLKLIDEL